MLLMPATACCYDGADHGLETDLDRRIILEL